jgi:hypothetical protein
MDPLTMGLISGGIQGVGALTQTIIGAVQRKKALEAMKNQKRPMLETPEALKQKLALYAQQGDMPGYQNMQNMANMNLAMGGGAMSRGATSSQDLLAGMQNLYGQNMMQQQQNAMENANFQIGQRDKYAGALGELANQQLNEFQVNRMDPYNEARAMYMQNFQTGVGNINQGVNAMGSAVSSSLPFIAAGKGGDAAQDAAAWERYRQIMGYVD